jgi:cytochrome c oxidase cbb3-type subunit 1
MEWYIKAFIRSSLLWFGAGIALGVGMAIHPGWLVYRPAHAHMNVVGFLTMLVFGVGYQLLPRLFGHALHSGALAIAHLVLANTGLLGMVVGFMLEPRDLATGRLVLSAGGVCFGAGAGLWIWNLWRTFDAADARHRDPPPSRRLPTIGE